MSSASMAALHSGFETLIWLLKTGVAVEKGTKAVISVNFSVYGRRTFNNLRTNFAAEIPKKDFFNSHRR
jgi:hypothetical protein